MSTWGVTTICVVKAKQRPRNEASRWLKTAWGCCSKYQLKIGATELALPVSSVPVDGVAPSHVPRGRGLETSPDRAVQHCDAASQLRPWFAQRVEHELWCRPIPWHSHSQNVTQETVCLTLSFLMRTLHKFVKRLTQKSVTTVEDWEINK